MKRYFGLLLPVLITLSGLAVIFSLPARGLQPAQAAYAPNMSIVVNTLEDELNSDGDCSLREAVTAANTNAAVDNCPAGEVLTDTITFSVAGRITVNSPLSVTAGGSLVINGGESITTSGGGTTRVWWVDLGSILILQRLAVMDGYTHEDGAGLYNNGSINIINSTFSANTTYYYGSGAGLYNNGNVTIINSTFSRNSATAGTAGGGLYNNGNMIVINSEFSDNLASDRGGGIDNGGTLTIINSTFTNNTSEVICGPSFSCHENQASHGGGIHNSGILIITNSTFTNNTNELICDMQCLFYVESHGGGIDNNGTLSITNSTFANNSVSVIGVWEYGEYSGYGGGIYNNGTLSITNSTFAKNSVYTTLICDSHVGCYGSYLSYGGGIHSNGTLSIASSTISGNSASEGSGSFRGGGGINSSGNAIFVNTIVANNTDGGDCSGTITDGGHNLDSDDTCNITSAHGSMPNTDPQLGPLGDNGGPTWTQSLLPGSPAIDAGEYTQCTFTDQRGFYRPIDGDGNGIRVCDIGSFEYGSVDPWGINLFPPYQNRVGLPGVTFNYIFNLFTQTEISDTYSLELGPHTWATTISTETLSPLPQDGSQGFTLTVTIPTEAAWYQFDTVFITVTSVTSPTEYTATAQITTQTYVKNYLPIILKER